MNFAVSTQVAFGAPIPFIDFGSLKVGDFVTIPRKISKTEYRTLVYKAKRQNKRIATKTLNVAGREQVLVQVAGNVASPEKFWEIEYYHDDDLVSVTKYFDVAHARAHWQTLNVLPGDDYIFTRSETGANGKLEKVTIDAA